MSAADVINRSGDLFAGGVLEEPEDAPVLGAVGRDDAWVWGTRGETEFAADRGRSDLIDTQVPNGDRDRLIKGEDRTANTDVRPAVVPVDRDDLCQRCRRDGC